MSTEKIRKFINPKTKIIIAMVMWGTIGVFVRGIKLNSLEIAFFRAFLGAGFLILISLINKEKTNKEALKKNLHILILLGIALGVNWIMLFQAMKYTTISNATLSYYFAPILIVVFSFILLKEKISVKNIIYLLIAILGLFLILKSSGSESINNYNHAKGILYGLAGAVFYAIIVILNKYIKDLSGFQSTLIQLSVAAVVLMPIVLRNGVSNFKAMDTTNWILMLILGIVHTGIAYLLYFSSIRDVEGQSIAILSYLDPIVAILMSFLILGESMNLVQAVGALLILSTAYMSEKGNKKP